VALSPADFNDPFDTAAHVTFDGYPVVDWLRDPFGGLRATMLRKHRAWDYERESRIFEPNGGRAYLPFDPAGLTGVILGCKASTETRARCDSCSPSALRSVGLPLGRASMHPRAYKVRLTAAREATSSGAWAPS
jgi:hypothetical protein